MESIKVSLKTLTPEARRACCRLYTAPEQAAFIASNRDSLREARRQAAVARPFGVYAGETLAGFAMLAWDEENDDPTQRYWLWRLMIHQPLQGRGLGRLALSAIVEYCRANGADILTLSTKPENRRALSLYRSFGFRETGEKNGEEIVLQLPLSS